MGSIKKNAQAVYSGISDNAQAVYSVISDNAQILYAVLYVGLSAVVNVSTVGGFAMPFITHAVMGLAMSATAQFAIAGAATGVILLLAQYAITYILICCMAFIIVCCKAFLNMFRNMFRTDKSEKGSD